MLARFVFKSVDNKSACHEAVFTIAACRDEEQVAVAIHARYAIQRRRIRALQLAAIVERKVVDPLGIVQIGIDARIVAVVENGSLILSASAC